MSTILGKRKRRRNQQENPIATSHSADQARYQDALRKHFEATFELVESEQNGSFSGILSKTVKIDLQDESTDTESEWEGISDADSVEVVSHVSTTTLHSDESISKSLRKRYMSSKPPQADKQIAINLKQRKGKEETSQDASGLMAEDIELQRLLSESHLLQGATSSTLVPTLKTRQAAQDLRLQVLGAKQSVSTIGAGNAPMAIRKGMENKKRAREQTRRQEAKESGIILERDTESSSKIKQRKRGREVGAPAVGKWRGGTLMLGKSDIAEIEGQRFANAHGKKRKGRTKARNNQKLF